MIGYYVHHHGSGHLHRAAALSAALKHEVVVISSLDKPDNWVGDWVRVPRDDTGASVHDVTAHGRFHWLPQRDRGLRARMSRLASWIYLNNPELLISDVSVEVTVLARLHGVPVLTVMLPGRRDDAPHQLAMEISATLVAAWPEDMPHLLPGVSESVRSRVHYIGGVSRFPVDERSSAPRRGDAHRVAVMMGAGGNAPSSTTWARARSMTPEWDWTIMGYDDQQWHQDPYQVLLNSDVAVIQAGQNAVAEVAAARLPAVIIPADRPHDEQRTTARALSHDWPALVIEDPDVADWSQVLDQARALDIHPWQRWCDGRAGERFAAVVDDLLAAAPRLVE
ncbi:conserved hypothetical protein [metagenome]|uniref:Glycosyl transferase family 28 C-terminal domain-containing protein n=1 Tax=metagenome TaxID=256318 RepID=A0A2P2C7I6_9ZZZZ